MWVVLIGNWMPKNVEFFCCTENFVEEVKAMAEDAEKMSCTLQQHWLAFTARVHSSAFWLTITFSIQPFPFPTLELHWWENCNNAVSRQVSLQQLLLCGSSPFHLNFNFVLLYFVERKIHGFGFKSHHGCCTWCCFPNIPPFLFLTASPGISVFKHNF